MRVAGETNNEHPEKMTQAALSTKAGIARSTITNHKELSNRKERAPNPTLEKICAIADTLNVPPAFLLMRPEDWLKLAQTIEYYPTIREARHANPIWAQIANSGNTPPTEQAKLALKLAKTLEIINIPSSEVLETLSPDDARDLQDKANKQIQCVFASSSLPPINHMNHDERLAAFVFCVIFGASYRQE